MRLRFHVTRHPALRLVERRVPMEYVKSVVCYADKSQFLRLGKKRGKVNKYWKTVDGKTLAVVAEIKNQDCWLITACYED